MPLLSAWHLILLSVFIPFSIPIFASSLFTTVQHTKTFCLVNTIVNQYYGGLTTRPSLLCRAWARPLFRNIILFCMKRSTYFGRLFFLWWSVWSSRVPALYLSQESYHSFSHSHMPEDYKEQTFLHSKIYAIHNTKVAKDSLARHSLPDDDQPGLSVLTLPTPPSYTPSRVSWRSGEIVTSDSIAQSATATVLFQKKIELLIFVI